MPDHVWYASYGSNLLRERFMAYIQGGRAPGSSLEQIGCADPTPPAQDHGILILHPLFFADSAPQWEDGGVAFVRAEKDEGAKTLGRMYLVSDEQFEDVVLQENGYRSLSVDLGMDLQKTVEDGTSQLRSGRYGTILHLGDQDGFPIFTFTAPLTSVDPPLNAPGPRYLSVIARGLAETFGLSPQGILEYLRDVPGVRDRISEGELTRIVGQTSPPFPSSMS